MRHLPTLLIACLSACNADPHAQSPDRIARTYTDDQGDIGVVVAGNDAFSWDLYRELATGDENLFFSPFSVAAALGMTSAGAGSDTLAQLQAALHVDLPAEAWHPAFGGLIDDLNGDNQRGYRLEIANRLFGQDGTPWAADFLATCEDDWRAPMEALDFIADPDGARDHINGWVSDRTEARIPELLPPGIITADTRLVLANAIYFVGTWWTQFDAVQTRPEPFTRIDGSEVEVEMMNLDLDQTTDDRVRAAYTDDAAIVRIPYEDDEVSAWIVLPYELDGLTAIEPQLTADTFRDWIAPIDSVGEPGNTSGMLSIPKLELRWQASLVPALQALGVVDAFDAGLADFSPMADDGFAADFSVSDVVHQAWMKLDEQGTEATAATAVVVNESVSADLPLRCDHPFLLVIRDDLTGSLLFIARVMDPTAG
jgi:serpin B